MDGTILNYINDLGHLAVGFEGGQNIDPVSADHHEMAIWTILTSAGCLPTDSVPQLPSLRDTLTQATQHVPKVLEIVFHLHGEEDDAFVMQPGYTNFQVIQRGQLLAQRRQGAVRARTAGRILVPLYQKQGSDGFFIVPAVKPVWLTVSEWLRSLKLERVLHWLPGVRRHPEQEDTLIIHPQVARWLVLRFFHL